MFDKVDDEFGEGRLVFDGGLDEDGIAVGGRGSCSGIVGGMGSISIGVIVSGFGESNVRVIHKHIITLLLDIWKKV